MKPYQPRPSPATRPSPDQPAHALPKPNVPKGAKLRIDGSPQAALPQASPDARWSPREGDGLPLYTCTPEEEAFLDDLQHRIFNYFWNEVFIESGIAIDHTDNKIGKVAATGFELAAICIGVQRGWITYDEGYTRTHKILDFFWNNPADPADRYVEGQFGLFWHFVDGTTGARKPVDCVAVCDSADFIAGALIAGQYFRGTPVQKLAQRLFDDVEWDRFVSDHPEGGPGLMSYGWVPPGVSESYPDVDGLLPFNMKGLDDNSQLTYAMALGSDTHPITRKTWQLYVDSLSEGEYEGIPCLEAGQIFCRQVPQSFIRMSRKRDRKADYFLDFVNAYLADRAFNMKVNGYPPQAWGLNDCFGKDTYTHSAPPGPINNDGTICTVSFVGALPHIPGLALEATKYAYDTFGERIWSGYGFSSSYNLKNNFVSPLHVGIELGPMIMMIENFRTGMMWDLFMRNRCMKNFIQKAGMVAVVDDFELPSEAPPYAAWSAEGGTVRTTATAAQHGRYGLALAPTSDLMHVTARLTENDLVGYGIEKFLGCWTRDADILACRLRINGADETLTRVGQLQGHGWTHHYFSLPALAATSLITGASFDLQPLGQQPALDNIVLEEATDLVAPGPVTNLEVATGSRGGTLDVRWTAPDGGGDQVAHYLVRSAPRMFRPDEAGPAFSDTVVAAHKAPGETEAATLLFDPGQTRFISIAAVDMHGHRGPFCLAQGGRANDAPLKRLAYDFEDGNVEGCVASADSYRLRVRSVPGVAKANKALFVEYTKAGAWDHLLIDVDPVLVAHHRYLAIRVRGDVALLGKLWANEDAQAEIETLAAGADAFKVLRFDLNKASMPAADRGRVVKVLLFPQPGKPEGKGSFYLDDITFEN
jgi:hypothetical protein